MVHMIACSIPLHIVPIAVHGTDVAAGAAHVGRVVKLGRALLILWRTMRTPTILVSLITVVIHIDCDKQRFLSMSEAAFSTDILMEMIIVSGHFILQN